MDELTRLPLLLLPLLSPLAASPLRARRRLAVAAAGAGVVQDAAAMSASAAGATAGGEYPSPVSPPYPAASKDVELRRAMTASARSGAYASAAVVFEDEWLAVVDKPAGVYCDALLSALPCSAADASGDPSTKPNLHLANRLDRDTSGLMIITKCNKVAGKLVKAFTEHKVKKTYLALCVGYPPVWEKIKICSGHGRSKHGAWRVYAMSDVGRTLPGGSSVRDMSTKFEVVGTHGKGQFREPANFDNDDIESIIVQKAADCTSNDDAKSHMILVRAYPQSGRTHQIRLHCQYLGFPIRGDVKYGGVIEWNGVDCDGHALHAESLSFVHPVTGLPVTFRAPLPPWADEFIQQCDKIPR